MTRTLRWPGTWTCTVAPLACRLTAQTPDEALKPPARAYPPRAFMCALDSSVYSAIASLSTSFPAAGTERRHSALTVPPGISGRSTFGTRTSQPPFANMGNPLMGPGKHGGKNTVERGNVYRVSTGASTHHRTE